jgi:hypothetical protein
MCSVPSTPMSRDGRRNAASVRTISLCCKTSLVLSRFGWDGSIRGGSILQEIQSTRRSRDSPMLSWSQDVLSTLKAAICKLQSETFPSCHSRTDTNLCGLPYDVGSVFLAARRLSTGTPCIPIRPFARKIQFGVWPTWSHSCTIHCKHNRCC